MALFVRILRRGWPVVRNRPLINYPFLCFYDSGEDHAGLNARARWSMYKRHEKLRTLFTAALGNANIHLRCGCGWESGARRAWEQRHRGPAQQCAAFSKAAGASLRVGAVGGHHRLFPDGMRSRRPGRAEEADVGIEGRRRYAAAEDASSRPQRRTAVASGGGWGRPQGEHNNTCWLLHQAVVRCCWKVSEYDAGLIMGRMETAIRVTGLLPGAIILFVAECVYFFIG